MNRSALHLPLAVALAAVLAAQPAAAQKKDKDKDHDRRGRVEQVRRDDDRVRTETRRTARRVETTTVRRNGKGVPRGWCTGRGNPHNTVENCGRDGTRYDPRYDGRRDDRYGSDSYQAAHDRHHREADRACRARAAQRPLDVRWQIQVRAECRQRHEVWHDRYDPARQR